MCQESKHPVHLARSDQPADQAQRKAGRYPVPAAMGVLYGLVDRLGATDQFRPVAAGRQACRQPRETSEKSASLQQVEKRQHQAEHACAH